MEKLKSRGYEVLYLTEPIDEVALSTLQVGLCPPFVKLYKALQARCTALRPPRQVVQVYTSCMLASASIHVVSPHPGRAMLCSADPLRCLGIPGLRLEV